MKCRGDLGGGGGWGVYAIFISSQVSVERDQEHVSNYPTEDQSSCADEMGFCLNVQWEASKQKLEHSSGNCSFVPRFLDWSYCGD